MTAMHVRCRHTKGNRTQECVLVLMGDRRACVPIAPAENAAASIAAGLALTAVGVITVRNMAIDVSRLQTPEQLDAAMAASGGFLVGPDWTYRTRVPIIGTMLMRGDENISTRERVPDAMFAGLTPNRAPPSKKVLAIVCGIGAAILATATIVYLATGTLELLFGIGFWGVLMIGTGLFAFLRMRRVAAG